MIHYQSTPGKLWSIILAGTDRDATSSLIQRWLGHPKPKQYCTFVGNRSMFQHTWDRATVLSQPLHTVTLIAGAHHQEALPQLESRSGGIVVLEPRNAGAVAGMYLSLAYVRAKDPYATVVVYPADHFVYPEHAFLAAVQRAVWVAEWLPDRLVVLGASPAGLEPDYAWLIPGETLDGSKQYRIRAVEAVLERPTSAEADDALAQGALWSTSVMAAKAETLWQLGWHRCPELMARFERLHSAIGAQEEDYVLDDIYFNMPPCDLTSDVLRPLSGHLAVVEINGALWSDWGTPERITHTLRRIGRQPAFPLTCLSGPFVPLPQTVSEGDVWANL